jgi:hypothetical protein
MLKYCYVDIDSSTDVRRMFQRYEDQTAELRRQYPSLKFVHVTVPLTTVEPAAKAWLKTLLGRTTARDINQKRNQYNSLLKQAYWGVDPIFDLAEVESTHADGSRSYFTSAGQKIYVLAPEWTSDGGHLNEPARRMAAQALLALLARL